MSDYKYPIEDATFVLNTLVDFDGLCSKAGLEEVNSELAAAVLEEAAKLGSGVLAPLNRDGDQIGAKWSESGVTETPGFADAYHQFAEGGWMGLTQSEEIGGQNLPNVLGTAVNEIWQSANMAWALCPLLTQGAMEAISHHASAQLQAAYLPKMAAGEWTGTMNLTEPDAGSDLAVVKTKAEPKGDAYAISGQKIFITWGDHQMTDNIVHLVLARLPDAPEGVKGISLFVVPKFILNAEGEAGEPNSVRCLSIEHKLGIHGSPTCVMSFEGATGYLVGEPNKGLMYMFTMMNHARQAVGLQGLSIAERATQQAVAYARERIQGRRPDGSKMPIIEHPDVKRMLLQARACNEAMRALALVASAELDYAAAAGGEDAAAHNARAALFTPIVKGWMTELAQEITSLGVQVHGGMGFIEETGAAQHYRDARILPIYEGTNGIQALDLTGRKLSMDQGATLTALLDEMDLHVAEARTQARLPQAQIDALAAAVAQARESAQTLLADRELGTAAAFHFMMQMGYLCGGWLLTRSVSALGSAGVSDAFAHNKQLTAQFYLEQMLPRAAAHASALQHGHATLSDFPEEAF
ncbi:acyl-CoA dehydrogenase [Granulosicoccaceae sp. 1_MG-2023]|nr:acyl-CoA dehydrogenase [Granulosicoccaceae sp. 1_MG-2023]